MNDKPLLKTPGEMIGEAREAQDLTIRQLSERTKIPPPVLSALELDEYHKISGPLYIKSFLRTCAMDLGLDPEIVLGLYNKISGEQGGGPAGRDMIWEDEKVKVTRIGLPWIQIILITGIVAVLVGVGLFSLRGCGTDDEAGPQHLGESTGEVDLPAAANISLEGVADDTASTGDPRHESLIPPQTEAELKDRSHVAVVQSPEKKDSDLKPGKIQADTLSLGWVSSPPPPVEIKENPSANDKETVAADTVLAKPAVEQPASGDSSEDQTEETTENIPVEIIQPKPAETGGEVEIVASDVASTATPVEDHPERLPVEEDWIDSAWPLVLRLVCDAPQRIQVKRDGDRQFSEVRWPAESEVAPEVPAAGFEAGRAYRQGDRLVVFWGADDHFSLVLARVGGVEVAVNGRIRDITKLRAGQELILDSHSAGSSPGR